MQVSARIIERHNGRSQRFELTLDPAELGKVEVRIEFGADKKVHAVISAHDSAALSDLMKGGKALEATLRDAGMDVADGGVKFEVANGGGNNAGANSAGGNTGGGRRPPWEFAQTFDMPLEPETDLTITQPTVWPPGRLNLVA